MQSGAVDHLGGGAAITVSSAMSAPDIIALLVQRKCPDITDELDLSQCGLAPIAGGGFGDIYKGALDGGRSVAIKCARLYLQQDDAKGHKVLKHAARELYIWSRLKHDNILPLLGLAQYRDRMAMISPWMDNGILLHYIERNPTVDRCQLFVDISEGMAYLHKKGTIHGDIKGGNVLVSREGVAKLADFGCTQLRQNTLRFTTTTSGLNISVRWTAPEIIAGDVMRSKEADVYAFGMTLLEAITGAMPFGDKADTAVLYAVCIKKQMPGRPEKFVSFNRYQADLLWRILLDSWASEPSERPDSSTIRSRLKSVKLYATQSPRGASTHGLGASASSDQNLKAPRQPTNNTTSTEAHARPLRGVLPPILGGSQYLPAPVMQVASHERWQDPDNTRGYGNAEDAAMMAHVRALEEARKLAEGEVDEEDEESMQRYVVSKFGDQSGQEYNDTESESETGESIQREPSQLPTPEPWSDPDNPRRHGNAEDAAMMAHVRALEEARKLAEGEVDEEDEESMQRYVVSKFGDQSGQEYNDTESESETGESIQREPSQLPTPEPWRDPDNPQRRVNAEDAVMTTRLIRALEEARKRAEREMDEEDEQSIRSKSGLQRGWSDCAELGSEASNEGEKNYLISGQSRHAPPQTRGTPGYLGYDYSIPRAQYLAPPAPRGIDIRPLPSPLPFLNAPLQPGIQERAEAPQTKQEYRWQKQQAVARWLTSIPDSSYYIQISMPHP